MPCRNFTTAAPQLSEEAARVIPTLFYEQIAGLKGGSSGLGRRLRHIQGHHLPEGKCIECEKLMKPPDAFDLKGS